ncbi:hypothetical protein [Shimazuella kribbensis]|uniref:hypothetical protein n=1 Tax=Shimazuella kribbensis TaxID=139808 RepID=UPI000490146C|nr:hypothetical protein [Shimazuella kribbensis]
MTNILVATSEGSHSIADREIAEIEAALRAGLKDAIQEGYDVTEEILDPVFSLLADDKQHSHVPSKLREIIAGHRHNNRRYLDRYLNNYDGIENLGAFIGYTIEDLEEFIYS